MDLEKLKQLGAEDYYLDLKKYIMSFIDRNYPLTKEDMKHLASGKDTFNSSKRREFFDVMNKELVNIINQIMKEREYFLNNNASLNTDSTLDYNKKLFNYKQQILEKLYYYRKNIESIHSEVIYNSADNIKSAIENGISGMAVRDTLNDIIDKSDEVSLVPSQLKTTVEEISEMKNNVSSKTDESYKSDFMKSNSQKLLSALKDGITGDELKEGFEKELSSGTSEKVKFNANLVAKLKQKQLSLSKTEVNSKQFIKQ